MEDHPVGGLPFSLAAIYGSGEVLPWPGTEFSETRLLAFMPGSLPVSAIRSRAQACPDTACPHCYLKHEGSRFPFIVGTPDQEPLV